MDRPIAWGLANQISSRPGQLGQSSEELVARVPGDEASGSTSRNLRDSTCPWAAEYPAHRWASKMRRAYERSSCPYLPRILAWSRGWRTVRVRLLSAVGRGKGGIGDDSSCRWDATDEADVPGRSGLHVAGNSPYVTRRS